MMILKNGTVQMELSEASKAFGFTMRPTVNPDLIKSIKRWNKQSAKVIAAAIRRGDCKAVLAEMENTKGRHAMIRECSSSNHDKIVYDQNGQSAFWWDAKEKAIYKLEK